MNFIQYYKKFLRRNHAFTIIPNGKWKSFLNHCPPPLDTGIPDKHDFILIKEVDLSIVP